MGPAAGGSLRPAVPSEMTLYKAARFSRAASSVIGSFCGRLRHRKTACTRTVPPIVGILAQAVLYQPLTAPAVMPDTKNLLVKL